MDTKICGTCKEKKLLVDFSRKKNKYMSKCKKCHNEYYHNYWKNTEAYEKHKNRIRAKRDANQARALKYGVSKEEIEKMLLDNNGMCAICLEREAEHIDHCHTTGIVRGALCRACNYGLGNFRDNEKHLQNAIKYLAGRRE